MKISINQLKKIIKEEVAKELSSGSLPGFLSFIDMFGGDEKAMNEYFADNIAMLNAVGRIFGKRPNKLLVCDTENEQTSEFYDTYESEIEGESEVKIPGAWGAEGTLRGNKVVVVNDSGMGIIFM